jgi:trans-2-enoyl-CoA reductase
MMLDFANLKKGDWIVQNGANSGVGQNVIQLARIRGFKTVNIIRDRYPSLSLAMSITDIDPILMK